jgi:hypothetical protein
MKLWAPRMATVGLIGASQFAGGIVSTQILVPKCAVMTPASGFRGWCRTPTKTG